MGNFSKKAQKKRKKVQKSSNLGKFRKMKNIINSFATKYLVNVLLIVAFGISAATGLIKPGGGQHERPHDFRTEQITQEREISTAGFSAHLNSGNPEFPFDERESSGENIHIWFGLIMLGLMVFHTIHHWKWFKKFVSLKFILKNKLLSITVVVFVLMAVSGLVMWLELVPREIFNFREIHEVTGQMLLFLVLIHVVQRIKWYYTFPAYLIKRKTILAAQ